MQTLHESKVRRTPFGDSEFWLARANPFDAPTRERTYSRRPRQLSADKLSRVPPELARLGLAPDMILRCGRQAPPEQAADLNGVIRRLTSIVVRLALAGLAGRVLQKTGRLSRVQLAVRRRRA